MYPSNTLGVILIIYQKTQNYSQSVREERRKQPAFSSATERGAGRWGAMP